MLLSIASCENESSGRAAHESEKAVCLARMLISLMLAT